MDKAGIGPFERRVYAFDRFFYDFDFSQTSDAKFLFQGELVCDRYQICRHHLQASNQKSQ